MPAEALRMPLGPYRCMSWCVRRKRVPQALQRMGLPGGPLRHWGDSAGHTQLSMGVQLLTSLGSRQLEKLAEAGRLV